MMNRGDVYLVDLNPTKGHEINKLRPCVLIGATPINQARRTVVVIPLSTSAKVLPPLTIAVSFQGVRSAAICDQIHPVDKSRLTKHIGQLSMKDLQDLEDGLRQVLCL